MSGLKRNVIRALVSLAFVAVAVVSTVAATDAAEGTVTVTVAMVDATPLRDGNIVRASGVKVGTIDAVTLGKEGEALVTMTLSREVLPLHQDSTATVIDGDLLGERYVSIDPGTPSSPAMNEPLFIPSSRSRSVTDLQSVVNIVDDPAGTGLGMLLTTLGEGIGQNPKQTAAAISALRPAMQRTEELTKVLSDQNAVLSRLVATAEPVASSVATHRGESLDRLVGSATTMLETTASHRQRVQDSLDRLPGTLHSAQTTLAEVAGLAPPTTRTLKELRPITDDLVDISGELRQFSDAADPALSSLRPVLDKGKQMLDELAPVADDLHRGGDGLKGVADGYRRLADGGLSTRLVDLMEFMKGWTLSTSDYDAYSHYFKAVTPYTPKTGGETAAGPIPGAPRSPTPKTPLPRGGRAPIPFGGAENAPSEGGPHLPQPPGGSDGATGLSEKQENAMMDQLLGGGR